MGWTFAANWLLVLPFELTIIGVQLQYWKDNLQSAYFVAPFLLALGIISFRGSKWFGELEHFLGIVKVAAIVVFIFMGIVIASGGVPSDTRYESYPHHILKTPKNNALGKISTCVLHLQVDHAWLTWWRLENQSHSVSTTGLRMELSGTALGGSLPCFE